LVARLSVPDGRWWHYHNRVFVFKDYVREMLTAPPVEKCCEPFKRANHVKRFVTVLRAKTS
jgi:hypothetical protein